MFILRKTKSFNKSRYSRNRQYYRTGVFLCLWANIILVMGGYYFFYRLTLKFTYVWPIMLSLFILVFISYFSKNYIYGFYKVVVNTFCSISFILMVNVLKIITLLKFFLKKAPKQLVGYSLNLISEYHRRFINNLTTNYKGNEELYELLFLLLLLIV